MQITFHDDSTHPGAHRYVCNFVRAATESDNFGPCSSMAIADGDDLMGAVIFHDWHPERGTVEMSVHGRPGWLSRRAVRAAMGYIFDGLGCQMVIGQARSDNAQAIAMDRRIFGAEVVIPRFHGREVDAHVFTLTDDQWRAHRLYRSPDKG